MGADTEQPAWRTPYHELHALPRLGFAWEYIRRNPNFRDRWADTQSAWEEVGSSRGLRVIDIRQEGPPQPVYPVVWSSPPSEGALDAAVAWHPLSSPEILRAVAVPPKLARGAVIFDPQDYELEKTLIRMPDGSQELLLRDGFRTLQLHVIGGTLKDGDALFIDASEIEDSVAQLQALACFRELRSTGILLNKYFPPHPHAVRLSQCLQALDGSLACASHREIGVAIYGQEKVERDWSDPRENLRDQVRRLVIRGRVLMERGFLGLMR